MRIGGHDAVEGAGVDRVDVGLGQHLEQAFFAGAADVVAAVPLGFVEDAEVDTGGVQQVGNRRVVIPGRAGR